ncbi:hypothetical protein Taro_025639 [Colocasia esculenta]|uniref:mitogen-activated protein kinase kinase kinase n=1 Tax=Colocasia esculenta TaxID=4460 RepID=A0A843V9D6_COLES|nr:hypothetical protein [Colocasia esculenta]
MDDDPVGNMKRTVGCHINEDGALYQRGIRHWVTQRHLGIESKVARSHPSPMSNPLVSHTRNSTLEEDCAQHLSATSASPLPAHHRRLSWQLPLTLQNGRDLALTSLSLSLSLSICCVSIPGCSFISQPLARGSREGSCAAAAMPAWWSRKSKSRSNSSPRGPTKEEEAAVQPPAAGKADGRPIKKEKANSFDGAVAGGKWASAGDRRLLSLDYDGERQRHPLPPPLISPSPSPPQFRGAAAGTRSASSSAAGNVQSGSASTSVSSVSSSGTDEAAELGFYRYSEPVNTPRGRLPTLESQGQLLVAEDRYLFSCTPVLEHEKLNDISISPRKEFILPGPPPFPNGIGNSHGRTTVEATSNSRPRSPSSRSRGYNLSASPIHARAFGINLGSPTGKPDDLKGLHPLPLPPASPSSLASRSFQVKWKKGKLLGQGTFGHVFLGFNSENGQMCAIKEVRVISDDSDSKESLKQLSQEIALLSQLSHPNIVRYYGSELVEDTLSVYLEYVSGGSIHKLLQEYGPFGEPVIRSYAAQILSGLAYLHGRNTVHRDIKGANILVDPNGEVKLADFGMAKHISSCTSIQSFKGSPYWMAPEVIMSTGGYSLSVDIWSFGCTIIEMATSKPPWSQYEGVAAIFKVVNSRDIPEIPTHLSNEGKDFLKLCLQRDPSARPTAAQLMEHPFVRDQATIKIAKSNLVKDAFPSSSDGTHTPTTEFPYYTSNSPLRDRDYPMRHTVGGFPAVRNPGVDFPRSDLVGPRMNVSLPVSPCASPLRNFRQPNRSCLPSPSHPVCGVGALNGSVNNYLLNPVPVGSNTNYVDPWLDIHQVRYQRPHESTKPN